MFEVSGSRNGSKFFQRFTTYLEAKSKYEWLKDNGFSNVIIFADMLS